MPEVIIVPIVDNQPISEVYLFNCILGSDGTINALPAKGLWDTGAQTTTIKQSFADTLKLEFVREKSSNSAALSKQTVKIYKGCIRIGTRNYSLEEIAVALPNDNERIDMLIGMDIISQGILSINKNDNPLVMKFEQ